MKFSYYYQLKNGEIRYTEKQPNKKPFVSEMYKRIDSNETNHALSSFRPDNAISIESRFIKSFHGFDRQVRLMNIIKEMLLDERLKP